MYHVTLQEAQSHIEQIFSTVIRGEEVVVTDHEKPLLKMTPLQPTRGLWGSAKGKIWMADDFNDTPEEFNDYL